MFKLAPFLISIPFTLTSCSQPKPVGRRVYLAKGNISFVLPADSLVYSQPILYPADYQLGSYGEAGASYYDHDSSAAVTVYVTAYPNPEQRKLPWRTLADEKRRREELIAKNNGWAIIESFSADSSARIVAIDYHMPKRPEKGWQGQASYKKTFSFYGLQRKIEFWFFAPDNAANRQAIAAACATIRVNPTYLRAGAKPYPSREYQD
jgi:hypothetical protein